MFLLHKYWNQFGESVNMNVAHTLWCPWQTNHQACEMCTITRHSKHEWRHWFCSGAVWQFCSELMIAGSTFQNYSYVTAVCFSWNLLDVIMCLPPLVQFQLWFYGSRDTVCTDLRTYWVENLIVNNILSNVITPGRDEALCYLRSKTNICVTVP